MRIFQKGKRIRRIPEEVPGGEIPETGEKSIYADGNADQIKGHSNHGEIDGGGQLIEGTEKERERWERNDLVDGVTLTCLSHLKKNPKSLILFTPKW